MRNKKKLLCLVVTVVMAIGLLVACGAKNPKGAALKHVAIEFADYGTVTLELDRTNAPITVDNFCKLAESGFYDGLTIIRAQEGFVIQGGDPAKDGTGGSPETIKGEFASNGVDNKISHTRGVISMARSMSPNSASSQFFIMLGDNTFLDGEYAGFGHVTEGMEVIDRIAADCVPLGDPGYGFIGDISKQPVMTSVKVLD